MSSDYYSVVKKPIDMNIIEKKMATGMYQKLEQTFDDLSLMMDNAFRFFPWETQQSQDAVVLHRAITRKYTDLKGREGGEGREGRGGG